MLGLRVFLIMQLLYFELSHWVGAVGVNGSFSELDLLRVKIRLEALLDSHVALSAYERVRCFSEF